MLIFPSLFQTTLYTYHSNFSICASEGSTIYFIMREGYSESPAKIKKKKKKPLEKNIVALGI